MPFDHSSDFIIGSALMVLLALVTPVYDIKTRMSTPLENFPNLTVRHKLIRIFMDIHPGRREQIMGYATVEFTEANWYELYYRLGFTWNRGDRDMGCPDRLVARGVEYPRGTLFTFFNTQLISVVVPVPELV